MCYKYIYIYIFFDLYCIVCLHTAEVGDGDTHRVKRSVFIISNRKFSNCRRLRRREPAEQAVVYGQFSYVNIYHTSLYVYLYIYIYVYMCVHIYIYIYMFIYTQYTLKYMFIYVPTTTTNNDNNDNNDNNVIVVILIVITICNWY